MRLLVKVMMMTIIAIIMVWYYDKRMDAKIRRKPMPSEGTIKDKNLISYKYIPQKI